MRTEIGISLVVIGALALAACGTPTDPQDPAGPVAAAGVRVIDLPAPLDPLAADGASAVSTSSTAEGHLSVSRLDLPAVPAFTDRLASLVTTWTTEYEDAAADTVSTSEPVDDNELDVTWEVAAASGPILAVRLLAYLHSPGAANGDTQTRTVYGSMTTGES